MSTLKEIFKLFTGGIASHKRDAENSDNNYQVTNERDNSKIEEEFKKSVKDSKAHINYNRTSYRKNSYSSLSPQSKGRIGEIIVEDMLRRESLKENIHFKIVKNLYIKKDGEETTEIDLIYINQYAIYVIEVKNFSGWIFGTYTDKEWTCSLSKEKRYKFYNPIWQNKSHVKYLRKALDYIPENKIKSTIVFGENATLKNIVNNEYKSRAIVCHQNELFSEILKETRNEPYFSSEEIDDIIKKLDLEFGNRNLATNEAHVENLKKHSY